MKGRRSNIESGKAKFYGQLLAKFLWTELEISTMSDSNSVLKAAHARESGGMPLPQKF